MYVALAMTTKGSAQMIFRGQDANTTPQRAHFWVATHTKFLTCVGSRTATVQDVRVSLDSFVVSLN